MVTPASEISVTARWQHNASMKSDAKDPWLQRWLPLALHHVQRAGNGPVLELGCGSGRDTRTLVQAGFKVIGIDLSPDEIERARRVVPEAQFHIGDLREL